MNVLIVLEVANLGKFLRVLTHLSESEIFIFAHCEVLGLLHIKFENFVYLRTIKSQQMDLFLTAKKPNVHVRHKSMAAENIGNWYYKYVYDM